MAEQLFDEVVAAADIKLFGKHAQGVFRGQEMHAGDALVGTRKKTNDPAGWAAPIACTATGRSDVRTLTIETS